MLRHIRELAVLRALIKEWNYLYALTLETLHCEHKVCYCLERSFGLSYFSCYWGLLPLLLGIRQRGILKLMREHCVGGCRRVCAFVSRKGHGDSAFVLEFKSKYTSSTGGANQGLLYCYFNKLSVVKVILFYGLLPKENIFQAFLQFYKRCVSTLGTLQFQFYKTQ